jgi:tetratricopeptide (TPR) repeat protein
MKSYRKNQVAVIICLIQINIFAYTNCFLIAADDNLIKIFTEYVDASSNSNISDRGAFYRHWEEQFTKSLSQETKHTPLFIRILNEIGALQKAQGKGAEAIKTYFNLTKIAKEINDRRGLLIALENLFEKLAVSKDNRVFEVGNEYVRIAKSLVDESDDKQNLENYVNALTSVAIFFVSLASKNTDHLDISQEYIEKACQLLEKALVLPDNGHVPLPTRLYWLAQAYTLIGNKSEADNTYRKIIEMDQNVLSKLWMEHLRVLLIHPKNSEEYQLALEDILKRFEESKTEDDYEHALRQELGLSYYKTDDHEKAANIFISLTDKNDDQGVNAYNMFLASESLKVLGQQEASKKLRDMVVEKYSNTGSANVILHQDTLQSHSGAGDHVINTTNEKKSLIFGIIILNLLFVLVFLFYSFFLKRKKIY